MGTALGKIVVVILLLGGAAVGAAFYLGILDWRSAKTQARVQMSGVATEVRSAVDSGLGTGGGKSAAAGAAECRQNLQRIDAAKKTAAQRSGSEVGDISWDKVLEQLGGKKPVCPSGGTYTLGNLQTNPRCSIGGANTTDRSDDHLLASY